MPQNKLSEQNAQLISDKACLIYNYNKLESALIEISKKLEFLIHSTETGLNRNILTEANIIALNAIK